MVPGGVSSEVTQLNIESLWSGGPFSDSVCSIDSFSHTNVSQAPLQAYNGGNKHPDERVAMAHNMQNIREKIFQSPTGRILSETGITHISQVVRSLIYPYTDRYIGIDDSSRCLWCVSFPLCVLPFLITIFRLVCWSRIPDLKHQHIRQSLQL